MTFPLDIPPPRNWQDFEDFCCELWRWLWNDPGTQKQGRQGQPQAGVDIFGRPDNGERWAGVQCKLKSQLEGGRLTAKEILAEVAKARSFEPPLAAYLLATTAARDRAAQALARQLNDSSDVPFSVMVVSWNDIVENLAPDELLAKHYAAWQRAEPQEITSGVVSIPELPPYFLPRPEHLEPLKRALLEGESRRLGVTGKAIVGVQGMGGIGKTVLTAATAIDPQVEKRFADGVVWVTVGQEPNILELQHELVGFTEQPAAVFSTEAQAKMRLRRLLRDRSHLLVLDDVWELKHASLLDVVGDEGRLLITTRNREVLVSLGAEEVRIEVLAPEQARTLLANWAGRPAEELPDVADQVAKECGYLPLALSMIGAMVRLEPWAWEDVLERLQNADLDKIRQGFPDYPYPDLLRALEVSVQALDRTDRERYIQLAVFPQGVAIPTSAIEVLWSVAGDSALDSRDRIRRLEARSLVRRYDAGRIRLHDLQGYYVRRQAGDLESLHARLVDGYRSRCREDFAAGPGDGYFFERLAYHLVRSDRRAQLRGLLADIRWLEMKLLRTNVPALLADFDELPAGDPLVQVQEALRLSAHVCREPG